MFEKRIIKIGDKSYPNHNCLTIINIQLCLIKLVGVSERIVCTSIIQTNVANEQRKSSYTDQVYIRNKLTKFFARLNRPNVLSFDMKLKKKKR